MSKRSTRKPYHLLSYAGKRKRLRKDNDEYDQLIKSVGLPNTEVAGSSKNTSDVIEDLEKPSCSFADTSPNNDDISSESSSQVEQENEPSLLFVDNEDETLQPYNDHDLITTLFSEDDNSEVDSSDDENEAVQDDNLHSIQNFLRCWAVQKNITLSALSSLCGGLKSLHPCFEKLPVDGRTIMKTPVKLTIEHVPPGNYIHIGLKKQLNIIGSSLKNPSSANLGLLINIDGLPLYRSSQSELYPILFSIPTLVELNKKVFPIGIYYGEKKPSDLNAFLHTFLTELNDVIANGINVNGVLYTVYVLAFCCDAPAKSYLMGVTSHTGYSSCTRCQVHGITTENKRVFLEYDSEPRTHDDFVNRVDTTFQPRITPLTEVQGINFVCSFILDYMHLMCLGVMRTLLNTWISGPLPSRLSPTLRKIVSENLVSLKSDVPNDFVRKPRDLSQLKMWKATEYRSFLLYFGPIVLKNVLSSEKYSNFLDFHIASNILLSEKKCNDQDYLEYAKKLLIYFVQKVQEIYGDSYITHNFHNLIHITDDATFFSGKIPNFTLHSISAFPFENYLQTIKRRVRGHSKPLEQIGRRLSEEFALSSTTTSNLELSNTHRSVQFKNLHHDGPLLALCCNPQYQKILISGFEIWTSHPNNCCQLKGGDIVFVENIAFSKEIHQQVVIGRCLETPESLYGKPDHLESKDFGIQKGRKLSSRRIWPATDIAKKCVSIRLGGKYKVFPFLHCDASYESS